MNDFRFFSGVFGARCSIMRRPLLKYRPFNRLSKLVPALFFIGVFSMYCSISSTSERLNSIEEPDYIIPNVPECQPTKKFVFLKTYKCGTTTLLGLLMKYATKAQLIKQEVAPRKIRQGPFNRTYVINPSIKGDFIYDHIIWNRDEIEVQLGSNMVAFTVLRDPYSLFESYYSYINLEKELGVNLKGFIQLLRQSDPKNLNTSSVLSDKQIARALYSYGSAYNLGMPITSLHDDDAIDNHIAKIEKEMDLVMITERMEESLILFRYLMCWQPDDIVAFDKNVRMTSSVVTIDDDDKKELKRWLKADEKIYNHFYKIFEEKVAKYPGDIKREIQQRIDAREELRADCLLSHEKNPDCSGFNALVADTRDNLI